MKHFWQSRRKSDEKQFVFKLDPLKKPNKQNKKNRHLFRALIVLHVVPYTYATGTPLGASPDLVVSTTLTSYTNTPVA